MEKYIVVKDKKGGFGCVGCCFLSNDDCLLLKTKGPEYLPSCAFKHIHFELNPEWGRKKIYTHEKIHKRRIFKSC